MEKHQQKIFLAGGAGLVGQNLVVRLLAQNDHQIIVVDKHKSNLAILKQLHPKVKTIHADLAITGEWQQELTDVDVVVMLQAQIGGVDPQAFTRNNMTATEIILDTISRQPEPAYLVHVSSSVVQSAADDLYTNSKKAQEQLVCQSNIMGVVLRPTLMFGWFDRKHLGWLSRWMRRSPIFPIPGDGHYIRQPLYVGDFCQVIISCINQRIVQKIYDISGQEKMTYLSLIEHIKKAVSAKTMIIKLPYRMFYTLLWLWEQFDSNPPFTTQQLMALVTGEEFQVIDWPTIFSISNTPFQQAISETFGNSRYSQVILGF